MNELRESNKIVKDSNKSSHSKYEEISYRGGSKIKDERIPDNHQRRLRAFLKHLREEKKLSKRRLSEALNCTIPTLEKMEGFAPTKISETLSLLENMASIQGITFHTLMSILNGDLNESAEAGGDFEKELLSKIEKLDDLVQTHISVAIENTCPISSEIFFLTSKSPTRKKKLILSVCQLINNPSSIRILEGIISKIGEQKK
jgi:transcriptional regulator with XRE-family HTH domain